MPAEKATAIVLRTVDFSESSLVVTLFTRELGKVRAVAKGARRLKSAFESALDLLAVCRIVFLRKSSGALDLLTEAKLQRRFRPQTSGLPGLYGGYYVAELLDALTDDYDPHPDVFDQAEEALAALAEGTAVGKRVLRFELTTLRTLGHLPSLETCVECGGGVALTGRIAFGQLQGGVLCPRCRDGKRQVVSVSAGVLRAMAQLAAADESWRRMEMDPRSQGELRGVLNHYLYGLLGRKPQMHRYLGLLST